MAWEDELFGFLDDLEQQAQSLYAVEREVEVADRARAEYQSVTLAARLMASVGHDVAVHVTGVGRVDARLSRTASDWCLLTGPGQDWVVPHAAVGAVSGLSDRGVPEVAWSPLARLGLGSALRRLADAEERCVVHRTDGGRHEGVVLRVGADFAEVREGHGTSARTTVVTYAGLAAVQSRADGVG
ncbi:MAG: hypothetical protein CMH83_16690 [Nocardioides sp.]|nr:hypothetical protein [Nocardioides sp.]